MMDASLANQPGVAFGDLLKLSRLVRSLGGLGRAYELREVPI
jgi:hypothetical protein